MLTPYFTGMGIGAGLIIAIGSQNAFVLTQGIKKQYHLEVAFICALCDTVLIGAGVAGLGRFIERLPLLITITSAAGAVFLFIYGLMNLISAVRGSGSMGDNSQNIQGRKQVALTALALTLLNPHVYLDTVVLLGSISGTFDGSGRYLFGAGAVTMSYIWFFGLSIGAGLLSPLFRKPITWRILNLIIFAIMWSISYRLFRYSGLIEYLKR